MLSKSRLLSIVWILTIALIAAAFFTKASTQVTKNLMFVQLLDDILIAEHDSNSKESTYSDDIEMDSTYIQTLAQLPCSSAKLRAEALYKLELGDLSSMSDTCLASVPTENADPALLFLLGNLAERRGAHSEAMYYWKMADAGNYFILQGRSFYEAQQFEQAIASFNTAVQLLPNKSRPMEWLAATYYQIGAYHAAAELLAITTAREDKTSETHLILGDIARWHDRNLLAAIRWYKEGTQLFPSNESLLLRLGRAYIANKDYAEAAKVVERITILNPTNQAVNELISAIDVTIDHPGEEDQR